MISEDQSCFSESTEVNPVKKKKVLKRKVIYKPAHGMATLGEDPRAQQHFVGDTMLQASSLKDKRKLDFKKSFYEPHLQM